MTFTIPITVDSVVVEKTNITLTNIACSNGATPTSSSLFWDTPNTNLDSGVYCVITEINNACSKIQDGFQSFADLLILIVLAIIIVVVISLLGFGNFTLRDFLIAGIITIIFVGIINIMGSIMINGICSV